MSPTAANVYIYVDDPMLGGQCCGTSKRGTRCQGSATIVERPNLQLCPSHHEAYARHQRRYEKVKRTRRILESSLTPPPAPADQQTREYLEDTL